MDKIADFFKIITSDQYIGWILLGIVVIVVLIFICIVLHYTGKKKKAEKQQRDYRHNELSNLSKEEVENIANNVADPQTFYTKLEEQEELIQAERNAENNYKKPNKPKKPVSEVEEVKPIEVTNVVEESQPSTIVEPTTEPTQKPTKPRRKNSKPAPVEEVKPIEVVEESQPSTIVEPTETPTETTQTPTETRKQVYNGKWKIKQDGEFFYAELYASNGVIVLKTENYKSLNGVKNGIETIKKNVVVGNFATSVDKKGRYCFKLFSKTNRLICVSDYYSSKAKCESGINSVKRFAETASVIIEEN